MKQDNNLTLDDSERQRCEVWTRVMGYHRPVSAFNPGKHQEHEDRLHFQEKRPTASVTQLTAHSAEAVQ
ncbi:anaerobic ribonucleoside-triphosphate reductase [Kistimonas asteriae]|uniref:anaerobic ribonucleoside-triphosphate reductase n=1 Tax=Kistimonas asteriae TaxID=517724 RepID=UPI001BAAB690|nr:anaerobic ribonucleoside-triphosphate reductase [Kistimonas asteriae]